MKKEVHLSTPRPIFDCILASSSLRHAGMDGRYPGPQDASGHIHVNLGPGSPCRDDESRGICVLHKNLITIVLHRNRIFEGDENVITVFFAFLPREVLIQECR
jgi:hypothetical protein